MPKKTKDEAADKADATPEETPALEGAEAAAGAEEEAAAAPTEAADADDASKDGANTSDHDGADASEDEGDASEDDDKSESDEDDDDDDKKKKEKKKKKKKDKVKIEYASTLPREEAVSYFEAIVAGLKAGHVSFAQDDKTLALDLPSHVDVEVEATKKGDKVAIEFEIKWRQSEGSPLEISTSEDDE